MRVAVIGGGISGLGSAYVLAKEYGIEEVVLFEKEESLGGHAKTVRFDGVDFDIGFIVFNTRNTYIRTEMETSWGQVILSISGEVRSMVGPGLFLEPASSNMRTPIFARAENGGDERRYNCEAGLERLKLASCINFQPATKQRRQFVSDGVLQ
ncbi:hypothetical protein YC2023_011664 [Brassica napus]